MNTLQAAKTGTGAGFSTWAILELFQQVAGAMKDGSLSPEEITQIIGVVAAWFGVIRLRKSVG